MNTFVLKLIACVTMFIDHFTAIFIPQAGNASLDGYVSISPIYLAGRLIGRIAFPIYCFLLVEGFFYTRSRRKYMARMAVFALLSELPFDLAFNVSQKAFHIEELVKAQNVMLTLLFGLILMYVYEWIKMKYLMQPVLFNTLAVIAIVGIGMAAQFLKTDYGMGGILLIMIFYIFRQENCFRQENSFREENSRKKEQCSPKAGRRTSAWKKVCIFIGAAVVMAAFMGAIELAGLLAFLPIFLYNKERGPKVKYAFYAFYPVHLLILGGIAYGMKYL